MAVCRKFVNYKSVQLSFLAEELAVEKKDEKINVDLSSVEHQHNSSAFILQLQEVLHIIIIIIIKVFAVRLQHYERSFHLSSSGKTIKQ